MNRYCPGLAILALFALVWTTAGAGELAFVNVNVVTMTDDDVLPARTVIVRGDRIAAIGPVTETPVAVDATIVDGTDRYLMPGLAEMHGHVPPADSDNLQRVLTLFAAMGVTRVRGMLGRPDHLALRAALAEGSAFGPRLVTSGPSFNGNSVNGARAAVSMVRAQRAAGYDFLKIHPGLTRAEFVAMAGEASELGIRFAGHVPADVGVLLALESGMSTIDHLDGYMQQLMPTSVDPSGGFGGFFGVRLAGVAEADRIAGIAASTCAAGVGNVPTQTLFENVAGRASADEMAAWPEMHYMPAATIEQWMAFKREAVSDEGFERAVADRAIELRRQLIRALHDCGGPLLLGSDAPQIFNVPGFSLHRELSLLVASGLTPSRHCGPVR
ncbi:MAG: amidohydrolase [Woeseiaceae bacterium]|nr:amidohydrolase [Woeseiaceae bacterium]